MNRYQHPDAVGYAGTIEPADASWIVFVHTDGTPRLYAHRTPTGAIA